jgi:hypothetical protein
MEKEPGRPTLEGVAFIPKSGVSFNQPREWKSTAFALGSWEQNLVLHPRHSRYARRPMERQWRQARAEFL